MEIVDVMHDTTDELEAEAVDTTLPKTVSEPEVKTEPEVQELPETYRNKSIEDVVKMHQEAEKIAFRHAQEVGEVRKLADELIKAQLTPKPQIEKPQEIDLFENPQEYVRQAVESNPKVIAAEQYSLQAQKMANRQRLIQKHPDTDNVVQESEFVEWVKSSPVRIKLFNEANQNFDFDSGDELLSTYKQLKSVKNVSRETKVDHIEKEARKSAVNSASVDTGGTNESSKKVYRRADLMRLMTRDPARYEAMSDEIYAAYAEGRVK